MMFFISSLANKEKTIDYHYHRSVFCGNSYLYVHLAMVKMSSGDRIHEIRKTK